MKEGWSYGFLSRNEYIWTRVWSPIRAPSKGFVVEDPVIPENSGNWLLRVADGRGSVERGGRGDLELSERGLASLYSDYMGAESIALCGMVRGEERTLATATALFASPAPGMSDMF